MTALSSLLCSLERVLDGTAWNSGDNLGLRAACDIVRAAVTNPEVMCECVELELKLLRTISGGYNLAPFLRFPSIQAGLAFGFWPPLAATGPHEHTAWTITALVHNKLDILVYDWAKSYAGGTLVGTRVVNAVSPDVGYISAPTIHDVRNSTSDWSIALHVLSDHDGKRPDNYPNSFFERPPDAPSDDPYRLVDFARLRRARAVQMAKIIQQSVANPATFDTWFKDFMVGTTSTRIGKILRMERTPNAPLRRLRKIHPALRLSVENIGVQVRLSAHSHHGAHPQIDVNAEFADALSFVAGEFELDVESLPGDLGSFDRQALARALEDSCLFEALE